MDNDKAVDLWFSEYHTPDVRFSIRIRKQLYSARSEFQQIDIFDSVEFGRILVLDGYLMLTERDEFIYHEMITHVPMATLPEAQSVLVIGGGDGGAVRELCRYESLTNIDLCEIDEEVVAACREYLPQTASSLDDPRVHIRYEDGLRFVRTVRDTYDLIIVDSTDPFGPGEGLFTKEFYGSCYKALTAGGVLVNQHESPFYDSDAQAAKRAHKRIAGVFPVARVYQAHIPTYPSGHWLFGYASKGRSPLELCDWQALGIKTRYYNTNVHWGAFALPTYAEELFNG